GIKNSLGSAAMRPRFFLFGEENEKSSGIPAERVQGARRVGRAMLYGAGGGERIEGIETVWRVGEIGRGCGAQGHDFAGTDEVDGLLETGSVVRLKRAG